MENRPDSNSENGRTVESVLQTVTQDLKRLHQGLITQLSQEVTQLQTEKARLLSEVQKLQAQHQKLQAQNANTLSQQQTAQQQLWAKQLALALSNHLQGLMMQQINQTVKSSQVNNGELSVSGDSNIHSENAYRLLASLDSTFSTTFKALQQELNSYESSLSQQINRMHNLEQQGEAVLEALVNRLREQVQAETTKPLNFTEEYPVSAPPSRENGTASQTAAYNKMPQGKASPQGYQSSAAPNSYQSAIAHSASSQFSQAPTSQTQAAQPYPSPTPLAVPATAIPTQPAGKKDTSNFWAGLVLVLLSTAALSIHNVLVRVIGKPSSILGAPEIGGFINITILGNSLLILWLRMLIVLPLMVGVAMFLYPPVWRDLKKFFGSRDRRPVFNVVGSGLFLFYTRC
uniref:Uncharacterized protein n=1 Tax=Oscillatoriales cyanobacterium SpSt-402 TaxID=2282168 RepID=A0A832H0N7_9CYAN